MAATGERYAAARAHLVGAGTDQDHSGAVVDAGWTLRGGSDPDAAGLANLLANAGVVGQEGPLSEDLLLTPGGPVPATSSGVPARTTVGPDPDSQTGHFRPAPTAVTRLGLWATGPAAGTVGAAAGLRRELGAGSRSFGQTATRSPTGTTRLPIATVATRSSRTPNERRIHDDRTLAPLTVPGGRRPRPPESAVAEHDAAVRKTGTLRSRRATGAAVRSGLEDMVSQPAVRRTPSPSRLAGSGRGCRWRPAPRLATGVLRRWRRFAGALLRSGRWRRTCRDDRRQTRRSFPWDD
jgi:hypothetical protein